MSEPQTEPPGLAGQSYVRRIPFRPRYSLGAFVVRVPPPPSPPPPVVPEPPSRVHSLPLKFPVRRAATRRSSDWMRRVSTPELSAEPAGTSAQSPSIVSPSMVPWKTFVNAAPPFALRPNHHSSRPTWRTKYVPPSLQRHLPVSDDCA